MRFRLFGPRRHRYYAPPSNRLDSVKTPSIMTVLLLLIFFSTAVTTGALIELTEFGLDGNGLVSSMEEKEQALKSAMGGTSEAMGPTGGSFPSMNSDAVELVESPGRSAGSDVLWKEYTSSSATTIAEIARSLGVAPEDLAKSNNVQPNAEIASGAIVLVPLSREAIDSTAAEAGKRQACASGRVLLTRYEVRCGDSLWSLSNKFGLDINTLQGCNPIQDPDTMHPGQVLVVPNMDGIIKYLLKGQSVGALASRYEVPLQAILLANNIKDPSSLALGSPIFLPGAKPIIQAEDTKPAAARRMEPRKKRAAPRMHWPLGGKINSDFGWRRDPFTGRRDYHTGIDIDGNAGSGIRAALSGTVLYAGWMGGYGKTVVLEHANGMKTLYSHCSGLLVWAGQDVRQGQKIALVGSTGRSTGPHLHFEVRVNGSPINPLRVLNR